MDTLKTPEQLKAKVAADLQRIKSSMPGVYQAIQDKAQDIGGEAYALVRQGCAGKPNTFYAFENGHVVGTRFNLPELDRDVAYSMVAFGVDFMVVWPQPLAQAAGGV